MQHGDSDKEKNIRCLHTNPFQAGRIAGMAALLAYAHGLADGILPPSWPPKPAVKDHLQNYQPAHRLQAGRKNYQNLRQECVIKCFSFCILIAKMHDKRENWSHGQASYKTYKKRRSIYVGKRVIQNKTQAHELVNILCDLVPTLKKLHMPNTTTEIGLRAAKTLAMRGLGLRDSIQLVTWLHGLPTTGAEDFLTLMQDSPRATVIHVLEGCEQIALLNLVTQG